MFCGVQGGPPHRATGFRFKKMARRIWFDADDYNGKVVSETYAFPLPKSISSQAMEWLDLRPGWIPNPAAKPLFRFRSGRFSPRRAF
jgi:hypothetical protein